MYSFREFELDEERFELRRSGRPVRVEPRVLEVLAYLVRNRGRVVTKEELLEHVWKKSFVSESALTRCIMEGRKAIGDSSREEPLIRTVHGRGYRFEDAAPAAAVAEAVDGNGWSVGLPSGMVVEQLAVPQGWAKSTRRMAVAILIVVAVLASALILRRNTDLWHDTKPVTAPARVLLAILPISVEEEERELQLVAMSFTDLLESRLTQLDKLRVLGADYSRPLSVSSTSLSDFASQAGAGYVVSGSARFTHGREKAHLTLTLHQVGNGGRVHDTPLGHFDIPLLRGSNGIGHFAAARDRVARDVLATLSPALELTGDEGPLTPRGFESYRLYLLARERLGSGVCDGEAALELLRRSLEIDPNFAPAWELYGWAEYGLSSSCSLDASHYQRALEAANRALALQPGMGTAIGLKASIMVETGRIEEAYAVLREAEKRAPDSADLQSFLFDVLGYSGYLDQAKAHLERLTHLDPNFLTQRGWTPNPYLYLAQTDRFLELLPGTDTSLFRYYRGLALVAADRKEEAIPILEPAFRLNPGDTFGRLSQSLLAILENRRDEGLEIARELSRQRQTTKSGDGEMTYKVAQLLALAGDRELSIRQLALAVDQGFFCAPYIASDPLIASVRPDPRYREILGKAQARQRAFGARFGL